MSLRVWPPLSWAGVLCCPAAWSGLLFAALGRNDDGTLAWLHSFHIDFQRREYHLFLLFLHVCLTVGRNTRNLKCEANMQHVTSKSKQKQMQIILSYCYSRSVYLKKWLLPFILWLWVAVCLLHTVSPDFIWFGLYIDVDWLDLSAAPKNR